MKYDQKRTIRPVGFIGKDILAIECSDALKRERHYRLELAREFRQAVEILRLTMPEEGKDYER